MNSFWESFSGELEVWTSKLWALGSCWHLHKGDGILKLCFNTTNPQNAGAFLSQYYDFRVICVDILHFLLKMKLVLKH